MRRAWPFIGWEFESSSLKNALLQIWFLKVFNYYYFIIISPLVRTWPSFEQTWIPFTKGYLCPSLVEIGPVVLEKKIFKRCQFILIISKLSPLWEGLGLSFEQTWIPFTKGYFVPISVEICPVVLEKKVKMWKIYRRTDSQTVDRGQVIRKLSWAFSSDELKRNYRTPFSR